jgi:pyridoxamine 5'-phosphate oxidase-like protein
MSAPHDGIQGEIRKFIEAQHVFFVATAPLSGEGHVNLSPKGLADAFRVLDERTVAYLDYTGSGAETIAHLRENGRIVIMVCAFEGPPRIARLHGRGEVLEPASAEFKRLRGLFAETRPVRSIIRIAVDRVSDSCGYGVPLYRYERQRSQLLDWCDHKGEDGLLEYQKKKNAVSIDGLPALEPPTE